MKNGGWVRVFYVPFNIISVISGRLKGEHERLYAVKCRLGSGRISPPVGFDPATPWSEVGSANCSATTTLVIMTGSIVESQAIRKKLKTYQEATRSTNIVLLGTSRANEAINDVIWKGARAANFEMSHAMRTPGNAETGLLSFRS